MVTRADLQPANLFLTYDKVRNTSPYVHVAVARVAHLLASIHGIFRAVARILKTQRKSLKLVCNPPKRVGFGEGMHPLPNLEILDS